jgi:glucosylceramidase
MTRFLSISSFGLVVAAIACSSESDPPAPGGGTGGGTTTTPNGGSAGTPTSPNGGSNAGGNTGVTGGKSSGPTGGSTGVTGGSSGVNGGSTGVTGGSTSTPGAGMAGAGGAPPIGGAPPVGGAPEGGTPSAGAGGGVTPPTLPPLVTSAPGAYWKTEPTLMESTAAATVTVNDTTLAQVWEGFGGSFNEMGWNFLTTSEMQSKAIALLFSATDGAALTWGRIPMGASDYAIDRYSLADTGTDVTAMAGDGNRPPADTALAMFSLARDEMKLIPYIKAAQNVKADIRFWASPWTPPVWMKTGFKEKSGADSSKAATKPSYFDGGTMKSDTAILASYAEYFKKFVEGYQAKGIKVEVVSPQNEPGYDQNYPSCLWESATYISFIKDHLGPKMKELNVKVMLGTMSNAGDANRNDLNIVTAVLGDATAKSFVSVGGAQWGVLSQQNSGNKFGDLPVWATEHKCGNYPWESGTYKQTAPNDQAYAEESWGYIRDAIGKGKVTSYNAWNMVLDRVGLGNDTSRHWAQNALLVADAGQVTATPFYWVFRHLSQYVMPGANVVGTTGGDALAFKNPDGSLVAVAFNSGAANANYVVAMGGKKFQVNMPSKGWVTVKYKP